MKFNKDNKTTPIDDDNRLSEQENNLPETQSETTDAEEQPANEEEEKIVELQTNLSEMSDKYLRLVAEFDNYRKRNAKERNELIKNAGQDLIRQLLDVLDDADRAEKEMAKAKDVESLKKGLELVFGKLRSVLKAKGLEEMKAKGEMFDPDLHEALTEIPASEEDSGRVMDVVQKGYYLNDKIIRHAKVVVGK